MAVKRATLRQLSPQITAGKRITSLARTGPQEMRGNRKAITGLTHLEKCINTTMCALCASGTRALFLIEILPIHIPRCVAAPAGTSNSSNK